MTLSERDESDLAALASKVGSSKSDDRARRLIETSPEAAAYFRQISSVCRSLRACGEREQPPLPKEEAEALATVIRDRADWRHWRPRGANRLPWRRASGVAAAILLVAATWFVIDRRGQAVVAMGTFMPVGTSSGVPVADRRSDIPIREGELVQSASGTAVLNLKNGGRLAMSSGTELRLREAGQAVELQSGVLFVQAGAPMRVQAGGAAIGLEGKSLQASIDTSPGRTVCRVYTGRAKLVLGAREIQLPEGSYGVWDGTRTDVQVQPLDTNIESWAIQALQAAGKT